MERRRVSSFVRIRLSIRYALRESNGDLISTWKILYGVDLNELPTVKDVLSSVSERLDLGNLQLSIFSKDYEIPTWCSSQIFDWDDELDIWILPSTLSGQEKNVSFSSAKSTNADYPAQNRENAGQPATKEEGQIRKKKLVVERESGSEAKKLRSKRKLEKTYDDMEVLQKTKDTKVREHFSRASSNVRKVAKRADPENPGHFYFLSDSDISEKGDDDKVTYCASFQKDGNVKELKLTGKEKVKDLSNIALPYEMPKKKKKQMLKRQRGVVQQENVSFFLQKLSNSNESISVADDQPAQLQKSSTFAVENNIGKEWGNKALPKENHVDVKCSDDVIDKQRPIDTMQSAPLNPLNLKAAATIQFKVMELDDHLESYMSDWKQAQVVFYNPKTDEVMLKGFSQRTPAMFDIEEGLDDVEALTLIPWSLLHYTRIADPRPTYPQCCCIKL
ncbi:Sphere organelles protein SPH-1 [Trichuris trichiura]|uniref:Sphere organelles protein SPH-1 n=1 Tax=Trichuris trichiura TaxID=36087 RepID=A0A077YWE8_TRITR|nr:Sphere organelles protein SPH-1 [Trichuris trichiura]